MRRRLRVRTWVGVRVIVVVCLAASLALAQENPDPAQLRKMYDDALVQLNAAQERKNQLAGENEKLTQQLDALNKELAALRTQVEELKRTDAEHAEKMFFLRSHYRAWQAFIRPYPELLAKWKVYLENGLLITPAPLVPQLLDRDWPTTSPS